MPPTYSPFWKPFESLSRLAIGRKKINMGGLTLGQPDAVDAVGGDDWKAFAESAKLYDLWSPPAASPWSSYHKPTLFAALDGFVAPKPIPVPGLDLANAPRSPPHWADARTAIILDLPGEVSVAYGAWLALRGGYSPSVTFNNWPHAKMLVDMARPLGALLAYSPWVQQADLMEDPERAPPALVLDARRLGDRKPKPKDFDNRYYLIESDLPSGQTLVNAGIEKLVYVRLLGTVAPVREELDDMNGYLHSVGKQVTTFVAEASPDSWLLGEPRAFSATIRKTAFSTTKDPAFKGFRRNAAGGFGVLVPEPSSGGG